MDRRSFFAGLRVGLALGRTGRDAEAEQIQSGRQSAVPTVAAEIEAAGDHAGPTLQEEGGVADAP